MILSTHICDCCRKETSETAKVFLPIIAKYEHEQRMMIHEMDICAECAFEFTKLFYKIANEHNSSGIVAIMQEVKVDDE